MKLFTIYYVEVNLICIVLLLLLRRQQGNQSDRRSTEAIAFNRLLSMTVVLCVADAVSGCCHGRIFPGARILLEAANIIFFVTLTLIAFQWMIYVDTKLKLNASGDRKKLLLTAIPLIGFLLVAVSNPFTHLLFTLDEHNNYARGPAIWLHWVITGAYMIIATVRTFRALAAEKNRQRRQEIKPLLYFIIAPVAAALAQMAFYGVTSTQVGITLSLIMIFLMMERNQILTDALTGLNNRRGMDNYLDDYVQRHAGSRLCLIMMDLNDFKQINDRFGHLAGDRALRSAADVLRGVCAQLPDRPFLCRYGGDEFLIAGIGCGPEEFEILRALLKSEVQKKNRSSPEPYELGISVGAASGRCADADDVERLLHEADSAMYEDKKTVKPARARRPS